MHSFSPKLTPIYSALLKFKLLALILTNLLIKLQQQLAVILLGKSPLGFGVGTVAPLNPHRNFRWWPQTAKSNKDNRLVFLFANYNKSVGQIRTRNEDNFIIWYFRYSFLFSSILCNKETDFITNKIPAFKCFPMQNVNFHSKKVLLQKGAVTMLALP